MRILLGVTGGIAAYKSVSLMRLLQKEGHDVRVVMSENAARFVSPLTFQALCEFPVTVNEFATGIKTSSDALSHIDTAKWAELIVIAPATANTIAKMAAGIADNLLTSMLLAASCPVAVFPAMNNNMYAHPATQANLKTLISRGIDVSEPAVGKLACGDTAQGKMPEPEFIVNYLKKYCDSSFKGLKVLVSAGPTVEAIDPVRYISNRSSGKMGYAVAGALQSKGAIVTLVSGPVTLTPPVKDCIMVESAAQMLTELEKRASDCDILIMAAAVADYTLEANPQKIKKTDSDMELRLKKTPDILKTLSANKRGNQVFVGFAAESEKLLEHAAEKLKSKKLDLIVANDISRSDIGFNADDNEVVLLYGSEKEHIDKASKNRIAEIIINKALELYKGRNK